MNPRSQTSARAIADLSSGTILATVDIAVPAERVFQALTTELVTQWWGSPETYQTTAWQADLRVGGRWRATGRGADGAPFAVEGEYLEIDRPRRLVQTWKPDWDGGNVTTLTYNLEPIEGGTRLTLRHEGFAGRPESCQMHGSGWELVLGWLGRFAGGSGATPAYQARTSTKLFLCRLLPPRPSFPADITEAEGRVMQAHVAYWTELLGRGVAHAFGPVADPKGVWGLGLIEADSPDEVAAILAKDPAGRAGLGFKFETCPMVQAVLRA